MTRQLARWTLALALVSCGGSPPPPAAGGDEEEFEETGSLGALANLNDAPALPTRAIGEEDRSSDMSGLTTRVAEVPADTQTIYRRLAPATVIVRSETSMGTGVIVGPRGLVLTNHHVIEHAANDDFRMRVTVEFGHVGDTGSMVPDGEQQVAYVLKMDEDRDLALLRVEEPPEGRPIVSLAAGDPTPGATVTTCGHGNVGMLWAVRQCEVEATGRLEETYSRLAAVCGHDPDREACRHLREQMHEGMTGLVIQSSCPLSPGDSGGPLVDPQGRLVGLNVMTISNAQRQYSNFHVHVREVRAFLTQVPTDPLVSVPTPWIEHESFDALDQDLDGRWDSIVLRRRGVVATLYDLDQDTPDSALSALEQRVDNHGFDAEMGIVRERGHRFVFFDTSGDGVLDQVLTLDEHHRVSAAHTIRENGGVTPTEVAEGPAIRSSRVAPALRPRFERIFHAHLTDHPEPLPALLRQGRLSDADRDGVMDSVYARRGLVQVVAVDVDQNTTRDLSQADVAELVRNGGLDAEFSLVQRRPVVFTFYDRDDDGRMDVGLRTAPRSPVVAGIVPMEGGENQLNNNDVIGTLAIRGDWFGERAAAFTTMMHTHVRDSWATTAADVSALPDPVGHHASLTARASHDEDGWDGYVLRFEHDGFITSLIDVDRNSWRGRNRRHRDDLSAAVRDGHFSAEFAAVSTRGANWAFYDTNHDGTWDTVISSVQDGSRVLRNAFTRVDDAFVHAPDLVEGRLIRPALIRRRHRARFDTLVRAYYNERFVAPAE